MLAVEHILQWPGTRNSPEATSGLRSRSRRAGEGREEVKSEFDGGDLHRQQKKKSSAILKYLLTLKSHMTHCGGVEQLFCQLGLFHESWRHRNSDGADVRLRKTKIQHFLTFQQDMFCLFTGCFISTEHLAVADSEGELK